MTFDPDRPLHDQSTLYGRLRHFAGITNPLMTFTPTSELLKARDHLRRCRSEGQLIGSSKQFLHSQRLVQSAFHPDTGDLQMLPGRMCFNAWGGTMVCGAMMIWYKSTPAVLFWQWANQSFNALVNYTNRNAKSTLTTGDIAVAYTSAVTGALAVAVGMKQYIAKKNVSSLVQKLVPLGAVLVANSINIPMMRQNELKHGLEVTDSDGRVIGQSKMAAVKAISSVVLSRNLLVIPCMVLTPVIMEKLYKMRWFVKNMKVLNIPTQLVLTFALYGAMVPVACGLFPQHNSIEMKTLKRFEPEAYELFKTSGVDTLYFNKGL